MIAIFDYGAGNLQSVKNTLDAIGASYELTRDSAGLRRASKIILPGVGHFGQMMRALDDLGVRETLIQRIRARSSLPGHLPGLAGSVHIKRGSARGARPRNFRRRCRAISVRRFAKTRADSAHGLESSYAAP